jgi:hypothetical protein
MILVTLGLAPCAASACDLDFQLVNNTPQPIVRLWTSPSTSPRWFEANDIYVPRGGSQSITFDEEAFGSDRYQDLKVQFQSGTTSIIEHINLCNITEVTIDVNWSGKVVFSTSGR